MPNSSNSRENDDLFHSAHDSADQARLDSVWMGLALGQDNLNSLDLCLLLCYNTYRIWHILRGAYMKVLDVEAQLFRTLAHPFRLQILEALRSEEVCVCHLCALFQKPQPYVSKQLAELRDAGLVVDRRDGLRIYYRLADPSLGTIIDAARLALMHLGQLKPEEAMVTMPEGRSVPGCECPSCSAA